MANTFQQKSLALLTTAFAVGAQAGVDVHTGPVDGEADARSIYVMNPNTTDAFVSIGLDIGAGVVGDVVKDEVCRAGMVTYFDLPPINLDDGQIVKARASTTGLTLYASIIEMTG
jgi:hypothetical protein